MTWALQRVVSRLVRSLCVVPGRFQTCEKVTFFEILVFLRVSISKLVIDTRTYKIP